MIRRDNDSVILDGAITLGNVADLLREGNAAIGDGARTVDLSGVAELDSSALALLLAWLRTARQQGRELSFVNLPPGLTTIARLYGVADLLPTAAGAHD